MVRSALKTTYLEYALENVVWIIENSLAVCLAPVSLPGPSFYIGHHHR